MRPEHALEDATIPNPLFTKAIGNVLVRRAPTALSSSCAPPLRVRAGGGRGNHRARLRTSNRDNGTSSIQEGAALRSHGNGHLRQVWFASPACRTSATATVQGLKECPIYTLESDPAQHLTRNSLQSKGSVGVCL